jgi:hypothetical protein
MKIKSIPYLLVFLAIALSTSCKKENVDFPNEFKKSVKAFDEFKTETNNSYKFVVYNSSWNGSSSEMTFTINKGLIVERSFIGKQFDYQTHKLNIFAQWTETGNELNSHQSYLGLMTLDDVYERAAVDWLLVRSDSKTYFETNNAGLLSKCGYVPVNCMDDCFIGITITSITRL